MTDNINSLALSGDINNDAALIKDILKGDQMLRERPVIIGKSGFKCVLFFIDGMANEETVSEGIVRSLIRAKPDKTPPFSAKYITENILYSGEVSRTHSLAEMISAVQYGDTLLISSGNREGIIINTKGFKMRSIEEPPNERAEQGPREGFGETALINVALLRRKLQTPDFHAEHLTVGKLSGTKVFLCFIESLADKSLVLETKKRIEKINIDGVLDTNYIQESIRDRKSSVFKTIGTTERPDTVAARLLEGRVAIISDGSPSVITAPYLLSENFQSDDDYYLPFYVGSIGRVLRLVSFFIACFLTGLYVSLVTFHAGLLPTASALAVLRLRTIVPTSTLTESLILTVAFEILKEACARAPRDSGTALSVVGGLVIGEAAVNSQSVSAPTLIIVALAGVCTVIIPRLRGAVVFINIISIIAAGLMGLFGVFSVIVAVLLYILGLESFGIDYTESLLLPEKVNFKDILYRAPWQKMITRPPFNKNKVRQKND